MAEYRDIEPLRNAITKFVSNAKTSSFNDYYTTGYLVALSVVMEMIEKLDVKEIVRCKDCEYRKTEDCAMQYECECGAQYFWESDNAFCSWGKRKENGIDDE